MAGCSFNGNTMIIKYIIENLNTNVDYIDENGFNCFTIACSKNITLSIIKYLANIFKIQISLCTNENKLNCLILACAENPNLEIIKYLIENLKININYVDVDEKNCFVWSVQNPNFEITKYLIEMTSVNLSLKNIPYKKYEKFIHLIKKNYIRLHQLFEYGLIHYGNDRMNIIIKKVQPLILNDYFRKIFSVRNPFNNEYNEFIDEVDSLYFKLPLDISAFDHCSNNLLKNIIINKGDYSKNSEYCLNITKSFIMDIGILFTTAYIFLNN